jgi:excisionase family DNA binding protein
MLEAVTDIMVAETYNRTGIPDPERSSQNFFFHFSNQEKPEIYAVPREIAIYVDSAKGPVGRIVGFDENGNTDVLRSQALRSELNRRFKEYLIFDNDVNVPAISIARHCLDQQAKAAGHIARTLSGNAHNDNERDDRPDANEAEQLRFLRPKQVATLFDVTERTVINWVAQHKINALRTVGGHIRIKQEDVLDLLEKDSRKQSGNMV